MAAARAAGRPQLPFISLGPPAEFQVSTADPSSPSRSGIGMSPRNPRRDRRQLMLSNTHLPELGRQAGIRSIRAFQALASARKAQEHPSRVQTYLEVLQAGLNGTAFSQDFAPALVERLLSAAHYQRLPSNSVVDLSGAQDALYVILTGSIETLTGSSSRTRTICISLDAAADLKGPSGNKLDPYVIVKMGKLQFRTPVVKEAGPNPVFNWSATCPYNNEKELVLTVMEYDQYSRDEMIGTGTIAHFDFVQHGYEGSVPIFPPKKLEFVEPQQDSSPGTSSRQLHARKDPNRFLSHNSAAGGKRRSASRLPTFSEASGEPDASPEDKGPAASGSLHIRMTLGYKKTDKAEQKGTKSEEANVEEETTERVPESVVRLGFGSYVGADESGGAFRLLEESQLLVVPRAIVTEECKKAQEEDTREKNDFLSRWLPGAKNLDKRVISSLAACFQQAIFPRGHKLCRAGANLVSNDVGRVVVIKEGTCRIMLSSDVAPGEGSRKDEVSEPIVPVLLSVKQCPVGLLGEGAILGCASALFGLPEPFTAVVEEQATVLWVNVADRPIGTWPREIVQRLQETLRLWTEWHKLRGHGIMAATGQYTTSPRGSRSPRSGSSYRAPTTSPRSGRSTYEENRHHLSANLPWPSPRSMRSWG